MKGVLLLNHCYRSAWVNLAIRDAGISQLSWCTSTSIFWRKKAQMSVCCMHDPGPASSGGMTLEERQEHVSKNFLDPPQLWDGRSEKRSPCCRNCRVKEAQCSRFSSKAAWKDSQVNIWDAGKSEPAGSKSTLSYGEDRVQLFPWDVFPAHDRAVPPAGNVLQKPWQQEMSWQDLLLPPTLCWGNRPDERNYCHPDSRLNTFKEPEWQNNCHEPVCMDPQPAVQDAWVRSSSWPMSALTIKTNPVLWADVGCEGASQAGKLSRLCEEGELKEAVEALDLLVQRGCEINRSVFYRVLKRCMTQKDLVLGRRVHALVIQSGYDSNAFLANHAIGMYASHGRLEEATKVFRKVTAPNSFMWASIILAHARLGQSKKAIQLYHQMIESKLKPDNHVYVAVLKACATVGDLVLGKELHAEIGDNASSGDVIVGNSLLNMYAKCGSLEDAREVFDRLHTRNVVTWTAMIAAYARHGFGQEALALYAQMQLEGTTPADHVAFTCLLQACAIMRALHQGKQLHAQVQERRLENDVLVGNSLVDMYAKCGSLEDARRVFDSLPNRDVVTWNALIAGYVQHGFGQEALSLYADMLQEGNITGDSVTFVCLLKACAGLGALQQGKELHEQIHDAGLETDRVVGNSLVNMYAKCGSLEDARQVFDRLPTRDVVTWTAMIGGYSHQGLGQEALALYVDMQQEGITPANRVTFVCLLQACASIGALHHGKQLHGQIQERGLGADVGLGSCLVDMYSKCGSLDDAHRVFVGMPTKDVITWNSMIAGYVHNGRSQEALAIYASMQQDDTSPADDVTFVCLLQACTSLGALGEGKELHEQIQDRGLEGNLLVANCLVDMYAKCGSLDDARRVFDRLSLKDVVTWNVLLNGYAEHSDGEGARKCFEEMCEQNVEPSDTTFICLLLACSHAGLVHEGEKYFRMMRDYGIVPTDYHYNCMVDLLGRSGYLDEAESMLQTAPLDNLVVGLTSLLSACKSHGDEERGRRCFEHLIQLEPEYTSGYVLVGNMYASAGRWKDVDRIERLRKYAGALKQPAKACIEVRNRVHEFTVGEDRSDLSSKMRSVNARLRAAGKHVPGTEWVHKAVSEPEKEDAMCGHAEKLALAYGLLNTSDGATLLVIKNLRMCSDCHSSTKVMSRLEKREIVVRDAHRVHRFVDGACSCGDRH